MKHAYVFPGQGAQFVGMGRDLYENSPLAKEMFEKANEILGFRITDLMFTGTDEDLRQTKVTQPAIFANELWVSIASNAASAYIDGWALFMYGTKTGEILINAPLPRLSVPDSYQGL